MAVFERIRNHRIVMAVWARLAGHWRAALVVCVVLAGIGSVAGFKAFHYVEHDNRFCTACHLMADPFARFSRSAHSKIECHDCHKATTGEKLHQVYATVVHNQSRVEKHAHVPNAVCEACHVRGDSARWRQIAATAGHRVHLQSRDTALRNVQCVMCHGGTELHAFASVEKTCGRAGCHANQHVRLGRMADLQIYCATCHDFLAGTTNVRMDSVGHPLSPQARQCLSCHAMQQRLGQMEIAADPHRGQCGLCHDPHKQTTARAAVKSCTSGSCHLRIDTVSFHRGVPHPEQCTACHAAHSFRVEGANCTRCHRNIQHEAPTRRLAERSAARPLLKETGKRPAADSSAQRPRFPRFSHGDHRSERCASCHDSRERHGQLKFTTEAGCVSCHHAGPARERCATCHRSVRTGPARSVAFALTAGNRTITRPVRFAHTAHTSMQCVRCHATTPDRTASDVCSSCHDDHHGRSVTCSACHQGSVAIAADHKVADHATCASASCHGGRAANLPNSRAMCLTCHAAQQTHRPGRLCNDCHRVRAS